jgi:hypothetical protein
VLVGNKPIVDGSVDVYQGSTGEEARLAGLELEKWVAER